MPRTSFNLVCARTDCSKPFITGDKRRRYCGQSCAAIDSNPRRPRKTKSCLGCGEQTKNPKYCSNQCSSKHLPSLRKDRLNIEEWVAGNIPADSKTGTLAYAAKTFLYEKAEWKCTECGWGKPNPKLGRPILAIDHIDGNHKNNWFSNLIVLCYNCHTLTPTFGALNIGTISPRSVRSRKKQEISPSI